MVARLMLWFGLLSAGIVAALVVTAVVGGELTVWILAVIWLVGAALIEGALARGLVPGREQAGG